MLQCPKRQLAPPHRPVRLVLLQLLEALTQLSSRHLFLLCTSDNEPALRFYARRGYRDSGLLPDLVKPGLHEAILWKRLIP